MSDDVLAATDTTDAAGEMQTEAPVAETAVADSATLLEAAMEPEQKDAAATDAEAKPSEDDKPGAPEDYGDFDLPEGMAVDNEALAMGLEAFKDLNLPKEQAQKLVDLQVKLKQFEVQKWAKTVDGWGETLKADKEIGGAALAENTAIAAKALQQFFSPAFQKEFVAKTGFGLGNHPEFVRGLVQIGKTLSEHKLVTSPSAVAAERDARAHYPNSQMNP